ncbi:hypothetical protein JCM6882_007748 [Rhodosporidiobolus microsporus]
MAPLDLPLLHNLYQTITPTSHLDLPHPLLCLSQLRRKPPSKRARANGDSGAGGGTSQVGEVEWVVALGGKGKQPEEGAEGGKRSKAAAAAISEEWWEVSMCEDEIEEWLQVEGCAITPEAMVGRVKAKWSEGCLDIKSYAGPGAVNRGGLELIINVTETVHLSLVLTPCDEPPLSLFLILTHVIPSYISCTADRESCRLVTKERDSLRSKVSNLEGKLQGYKDAEDRNRKRAKLGIGSYGVTPGSSQPRRQDSGGAEFGRRGGSGEGEAMLSQGSQGRGASAEPWSPPKNVPGQTHRGALRPGDPGYAGNAFRPGRIVEEAEFDSNSESDSD